MNEELINLKFQYLENQSNKYKTLTILSEEQINILKEMISNFKLMKMYEYIGTINIPENISGIENKFKDNKINYKNIISIKTTKLMSNIINKELKKLYEVEKQLNNIIEPINILDYEIIKNYIQKDNIVKKEEYLKIITTSNNENKIKKILDYKNKINIINKHTLEKYILYEEKNIIIEIENEINSICYKLNIDYKNKTYKEKYYEILDKIKELTNSYKEILKEIKNIDNNLTNIETGLTKGMKKYNINIKLTFEQIKELSELDINKLINEIKVYETSKKQLTNESKIIFKK